MLAMTLLSVPAARRNRRYRAPCRRRPGITRAAPLFLCAPFDRAQSGAPGRAGGAPMLVELMRVLLGMRVHALFQDRTHVWQR